MTEDLTDALMILRQHGRPGMALYTRERIDGGPQEVAWLVREETRRIRALGPTPAVEVRAGAFEEAGVILIPILVRVGREHPEAIYETWCNAHQTDGATPLEDLARQARLVLHLYGDGCQLVRSLVVSNHLHGFAAEALALLATRPPWSMAAFDSARALMEARYPEVWDLWRALAREG